MPQSNATYRFATDTGGDDGRERVWFEVRERAFDPTEGAVVLPLAPGTTLQLHEGAVWDGFGQDPGAGYLSVYSTFDSEEYDFRPANNYETHDLSHLTFGNNDDGAQGDVITLAMPYDSEGTGTHGGYFEFTLTGPLGDPQFL